ncbi:restriction endonuclease subunit S [uncultured Enterococcus sp.]|uniref:restriction endonuclease subunit S n=1 Tax=uncultured Enterococcus sp. TaxID=167972 RepID=UPI002AA72CFC|nr:restriction endonuclease subunit S [uncultured Enterococcus sp.]
MTREMKDSGVEWIGEIPEEWETKKIGSIFKQRNEKVSDLEYPPLSVTKNGIVPQLENAAKSSNHNDRKLVRAGDFVINSRSDRKMSSGISEECGSVSLINLVLHSRKMCGGYTNYVLKNVSFAEEFYKWGTGIVADLWSTKWESMKKIVMPYPNIEEQKKISKELDKKVAMINSVIGETKQSIIELKKYKQSLITETVTKGLDKNVEMKDSGVEWIGKIPKSWKLTKIKYCTLLDPPKYLHGELPENATFLPMQKIKNGYLIIDEVGFTKDLLKKYTYFSENDIVIAKVRPSFENGNIAIAKKLRNGIGFGTSEIFVLRKKNEKINVEFLMYYLRNDNFINLGSASMTGVAGLKRISSDFINNYYLTLPNIEKQTEIVKFLDEKTSKIDQLIADKEQLIKEYESYKKSLIYEYVTGKKEV